MNKLGANRSLPTTVCVLLFHRTAEMFIGDYLTYPFHCRPFEANIFSSNLRESRREKFGRVQALHSRPNHTGCTWLELLNLVSCYRPRVNSRNDRDEFAGPLNVVIRTYRYVGTYTGRPLLPGPDVCFRAAILLKLVRFARSLKFLRRKDGFAIDILFSPSVAAIRMSKVAGPRAVGYLAECSRYAVAMKNCLAIGKSAPLCATIVRTELEVGETLYVHV